MKLDLKIFLLIVFLLGPFFTGCGGNDTGTNDKSITKKIENITDSVKTNLNIETKSSTDQAPTDSSGSSISLTPPSILDVISFSKVLWAVFFLLIGFYLIKFISRLLDILAEKGTRYRLTIKGLIPVVRIFGWILLIYSIIAGIFKPPVATLVAVTASVGIAVGFGAQDLLKNIIGGILILFDRPYQVGDKIQMDDYYGEVIKIGLRSTKIVTPDDSTGSCGNLFTG